MQPYFLPYLGYFQLIHAVDVFVVYDNIQFTKKGWFHRNRILVNGKDQLFTIPLKKDSDFLNVNERRLADNATREIQKILRKIKASYARAPYFESVYPLIESCFLYPEKNLFDFIYFSIQTICQYLEIDTNVMVSSSLNIDHSLKGKDKVIAICHALQADVYINPIGGIHLYDKEEFSTHNIVLQFLQPQIIPYPQFGNEFVPNLSIIDVLMFNRKEKVIQMLNQFQLI